VTHVVPLRVFLYIVLWAKGKGEQELLTIGAIDAHLPNDYCQYLQNIPRYEPPSDLRRRFGAMLFLARNVFGGEDDFRESASGWERVSRCWTGGEICCLSHVGVS
jgi:hypothetical protein